MITGRELLAWLQAHPNQLDDPVHLLAQDDDAPSYLTAIEQDCFDENEGPVISLVSEHEKASEEPAKLTYTEAREAAKQTAVDAENRREDLAAHEAAQYADESLEIAELSMAAFNEALAQVEAIEEPAGETNPERVTAVADALAAEPEVFREEVEGTPGAVERQADSEAQR